MEGGDTQKLEECRRKLLGTLMEPDFPRHTQESHCSHKQPQGVQTLFFI